MKITVMVNGAPHIAHQWSALPARKSPVAFTTICQGVTAQSPGVHTTGKSKAGQVTRYTYFTAPDGKVFYVQDHLDQTCPITLPDGSTSTPTPPPPAKLHVVGTTAPAIGSDLVPGKSGRKFQRSKKK